MPSDLIVSDNKTYFVKNLIRTSDSNGRTLYQPLNEDWTIMNAEYFTYSSAQVIDVDPLVDIFESFQVGDKFKITQGGAVKYFYVISVDEGSLTILGGTSYTFTAAAIDIIEFSRGEAFGFPANFNFAPGIVAANGAATYSNLNAASFEVAKFKLERTLLSMWLDVTFGSMAGATSSIRVTPPTPSDFTTYERQIISVTYSSGFGIGLAKMGGANLIEVYANATTLAGFPVTTNDLGFNISMQYTIP